MAPVLTEPAGTDDEEGLIAGFDVAADLLSQGYGIDLELRVGCDPTDGIGADAGHVGGFLDPGVGFFGAVDAETCTVGAFGADAGAGLCLTGGVEADEVSHVAAADEETAAIGGVVDHLGDPADGLGFDLAGHG